MNSLIIVLISGIFFIWAYKFYAARIVSLWQLDPKRSTPAFSKYDSVDYIPAKNWLVLFGHHFSSIAGAGPIIGPIIAVMLWGWLPALIWVILGSIFIGGVHDFGSLITSVREGGSSVADIAQQVISRRAKILLALFVWLALILVIAVFSWLAADTFVKDPRIVLPSLGLIPVAMLVGYLLYHLRVNTVLATLLGLTLLAGLMFAGGALSMRMDIRWWIIILLAYCYFASILPVNILLQPRDYLCSFLLFFSMGAGYLALILSKPPLTMPAYIRFNTSEGYLWPALFITVACGAVSGFHSLIASGTTSKQIASERHAKRIAYGGMLIEALLAILAIATAACLFAPRDNFIASLKNLTPIGIFGKGYGMITSRMLGNAGQIIAITVLNAFILTTLDSATRIARYLSEELFKIKNRFLSTIIVVAISLSLAISGKWTKIWPAFGASNQLVAALALFVLSCWLLKKNKPVKYTLIPAFFMLATTIAALFWQINKYSRQGDLILLVVSVLLVILAAFMILEIVSVISTRRRIRA